MKIVVLISRLLLGLVFTVFGANGFLHFIPMGPMPTGLAGQFLMALIQSHYMLVVSGLQVICGLLLLANRFVPLALTILGAIIFNIDLFHLTMAPSGLPLASVVTILWGVLFYRFRSAFARLFEASPDSDLVRFEPRREARASV